MTKNNRISQPSPPPLPLPLHRRRQGRYVPTFEKSRSAYDYNNVWIRKTDGTNTTIFIPESYQTTVQIDNNTTTHHYLWTPQHQDKLLADTTTSGILWTLTDHLGTVRNIIQQTSGTLTTRAHIIYDASGNVISCKDSNGQTVENPILFAYTGKAFDVSTQLQNNINRWYDATIGRWLSTDPIGVKGNSPNLYHYCDNKPTLFIDVQGLFSLNSVEKGPQTASVNDNLSAWWAIGVYPDANELAQLKQNGGGAIIYSRKSQWSIQSCPDGSLFSPSESFESWHLDMIYVNNGIISMDPGVLNGKGGPLTMADGQAALSYIEVFVFNGSEKLSYFLREEAKLSRKNNTNRRAIDKRNNEAKMACTQGAIEVELDIRLYYGDIGDLLMAPSQPPLSNRFRYRPIAGADFVHKPNSLTSPDIWTQNSDSKQSYTLKITWDCAGKIQVIGNTLPSGPQRQKREPAPGYYEWKPDEGKWS